MTSSRRENPSPMRVINKLTNPGGIRRVDLTPDTVHIWMSDGQDRVYRLVSDCSGHSVGKNKEGKNEEDNLPIRS